MRKSSSNITLKIPSILSTSTEYQNIIFIIILYTSQPLEIRALDRRCGKNPEQAPANRYSPTAIFYKRPRAPSPDKENQPPRNNADDVLPAMNHDRYNSVDLPTDIDNGSASASSYDVQELHIPRN